MDRWIKYNRYKAQIEQGIASDKRAPVVVVGSGVTGRAMVRFLSDLGKRALVIDEGAVGEQARSELELLGATVFSPFVLSDSSFLAAIQGYKILGFYSPGVNPEGELCVGLRALGITLYSELDLATSYLGMPQIAVTGTNGKTTTVNLIHSILSADKQNSKLVGNVGTPMIVEACSAQQSSDKTVCYVAEVSSFQLAGAVNFAPKISVWLNLDDDHLEWHKTMKGYFDAKLRITAEQTKEDHCIVNLDDPRGKNVLESTKANAVIIGAVDSDVSYESDYCVYIRQQDIIRLKLGSIIENYSTGNFQPRGEHNKINLCAAIAASKLMGASALAINTTISSFTLLAHRIELVASGDGIIYIDDSKGTNVSAVVAALQMVKEDYPSARIVLLLGGKDKEGSWKGVDESFDARIAGVICFGGDGLRIAKQLTKLSAEVLPWLPEAFKRAREIAGVGDVILLSPGCASFDAYSGYAERGNHFKRLVEEAQ